MFSVMVLSTVWMIVVSEVPLSATYILLELGSEAIHTGLAPVGRATVVSGLKLFALTTVTSSDPELAT